MRCTGVLFLMFSVFAAVGGEPWAVADQPLRMRLPIPPAEMSRGGVFEFPAGAEFPGAQACCDGKPIRRMLLENGNLRFTVPAGTKRAMLYFGRSTTVPLQEAAPFADFAGRIDELKHSPSGLALRRAENGDLLAEAPFVTRPREYELFRDFPIPPEAAGRHILLDADYQSFSKLGWSSSLLLEQLDRRGERLPGSAVDPRYTTMALPPETPVRYLLPGRLSPEAVTLRIRFRLMSSPRQFDAYGRRLKEGADAMPRLRIHRLRVRTGELLDTRPLNPEIYTGNGMRLNGQTGFFCNTFPQAVWAENHSLRSQKEMFWPLRAGTVEFFLRLAAGEETKKKTLYCAHNRTRKIMQHLEYDFSARTATLHVAPVLPEEGDPHAYEKLYRLGRKVRGAARSATFPLELPPGETLHLAVSWDADGVYRCFLNGRKFGELRTAPLPDVDPAKFRSPDQFYPDTVSFGMPYSRGVTAVGHEAENPFLRGELGFIRISAGNRYRDSFPVPVQLTADRETVAFFDFSRFDCGISGMSREAVPAGLRSILPPLADRVEVERQAGGSEIRRLTPELQPRVTPQKVLSALNYPVLPDSRDFTGSTALRQIELTLRSGEKRRFSCPAEPYMESVTLTNPGKRTLIAPFLLLEGEVDPRSYGDIADSLKLDTLPPHERIVALFQLLLRSEDYFISHQAEFDPYSSRTHGVEYRAMSMLNGYCAFECGPLNNLAVNLFVNVGKCPANQTAGYQHSFEQVFYDGKMHLFDLSAQNFFPSRNQREAASLQEMERDPFLFSRCSPPAGPQHFIRHGRRKYELHNLQYQERRSFSLRPGESFQAYRFNHGRYNDIQTGIARFYPRFVKGTEEIGAHDLSRVGTIEQPFPHYNNGFFRFDGRPEADHPAFQERDSRSFRYRVESPYPVVYGRYRAELADGGFAAVQVSDDGKTWRGGRQAKNGEVVFELGVRARQKFLVRVNAPREAVRRFTAETCVQMNPRLATVNLKKGVNILHCKSDTPDEAVRVTLRFRERGPELALPGGGYTGAAPELTRHYYAFDVAEKLKIPTTALPADTRCTVSDGFSVEAKTGRWEISARRAGVGRLVIRAGEWEREAVLVAASGLRIAYAEAITTVGDAFQKIGPDAEYPESRIQVRRSHVKLPVQLGTLDRKEYFLFTLLRPARIASTDSGNVMLELRHGRKSLPIAFSANMAVEFKKARYGREKDRFKWDFPLMGVYPSQWIQALPLPADGRIELTPLHREVEIAAVMAIPREELPAGLLIRALCGLNWNPWRVGGEASTNGEPVASP